MQFKAFAQMEGSTDEVDITERTAFWVTDNYLVGGFPSDGKGSFSVRIPTGASDPPQRGGVVTVNAKAVNSNRTVTTVTTPFTVKITDVVIVPASAGASAMPSDPASAFAGNATSTSTYAPQLIYPNDGVLLPPNLGQLEVHWLPGIMKGSLYEVSFKSDLVDVRHYLRCQADKVDFAADACVLQLDRVVFDELAQTHRGGGPIELTVRASNEAGSVGSSGKWNLRFAKNRVDGAVYYWTASRPPQIMRFDFGAQTGLESVLKPSDVTGRPTDTGGCVGCHILSHDGRHLVASYELGREVYITDLSLPKSSAGRLNIVKAGTPGEGISPGAFDPSNKTFIMPARDKVTALDFHDAATGLRAKTLDLGYKIAFPDWAPDDSMIALTRVYGPGISLGSIFTEGSIVLLNTANAFSSPPIEVVPHVAGKNRYNATFTPDSATLLYSESAMATAAPSSELDAYSDACAKTWAVAAKAGATPILLARAAAPSFADQATISDGRAKALAEKLKAGNLMDTYPRPTPFVSTLDGHKLMWFTVGSQRRAGLRRFFPNGGGLTGESNGTQALLWMFALDADQVAAGKDGSYPGFFLPFQDFRTSNHMAQWTQKYVSENPPPPPPADPNPPAVPDDIPIIIL